MAVTANVDDVEALKRLRAQVAKFAEVVGTACADAASDVNRTLHWLDLEQSMKWKLEERKRHDALQRALEKLRMKQLYKGPAGERQNDVDEQVAVKKCRAACEEAEWKLRAIKSHKIKLSREALLFQGVLQRLSSISQQTAPAALAELGNMIVALEKYGKIQVAEAGSAVGDGGAGEGAVSQARAADAGKPEETPPPSSQVSPEAVAVDWPGLVKRARRQLSRMGGQVVLEPVDLAGDVVVWKDGFSGRVFVGGMAEEAAGEKARELESWTREQLLAALPGVGETLAGIGDRKAILQGGEVLVRG